MFEGSKWNFSKKYYFYIKILLFTTALSVVTPLGTIYTIIGLFVTYWLHKIILIKREAKQENISEKIFESTIRLIYIPQSIIITKALVGR